VVPGFEGSLFLLNLYIGDTTTPISIGSLAKISLVCE